MSQSTITLSALTDYPGILRRRFIYPATILPALVLLSVYWAFAITPQYQASATLLLEQSSVPKGVIESTVISYADQQIEIVQGRVMSRESLEELVREFDPYPEQRGLGISEKAQRIADDTTLERVDPVTLNPQIDSSAFSLHYNNPDRRRAVDVAGRLAQLFVMYNQRRREEAAGKTATFLQKQAEAASEKMREVDAALARLKSQHGEALPELLLRNQSRAEDAQRQLNALQQQILTAQEKESVLAVQLSGMSPNIVGQSGDLSDIATVRSKLAEAELRYTPNHPEIKRLQHALETLAAQSRSGGSGIATAPNNPQYMVAAKQLEGTRNGLANLEAQAAKARQQMTQYEQLVLRTPIVEREFSEVLRRKQSLQNEYQQIQDKLQNAKIAQNFETGQGGERFTLLRAPTLPKYPSRPNRIGLILLGLVLGCGLAGCAVAIAEATDPNVRGARDLPESADIPLLGTVPVVRNTNDRARGWRMVGSLLAIYGVALLIVGATVVLRLRR